MIGLYGAALVSGNIEVNGDFSSIRWVVGKFNRRSWQDTRCGERSRLTRGLARCRNHGGLTRRLARRTTWRRSSRRLTRWRGRCRSHRRLTWRLARSLALRLRGRRSLTSKSSLPTTPRTTTSPILLSSSSLVLRKELRAPALCWVRGSFLSRVLQESLSPPPHIGLKVCWREWFFPLARRTFLISDIPPRQFGYLASIV